MKKVALLVAVLLFSVASVYAVNFTPPVMTITAAPAVEYQFDGSTLTMPVTVTGSPAGTYFLVFTKDKFGSISKVRNGYLGWHYVNKIDTCLYVSPLTQLSVGTSNMTWNGKDEAGNQVAAGDYTYYLWGVDNTTTRIQVTTSVGFQPWGFMTLTTKGETGLTLSNPILTQGGESRPASPDTHVQGITRWVIGGDPTDGTLAQTTTANQYDTCGGVAYLKNNLNVFFFDGLKGGGATKVTMKYNWVPSGASELQTDWGDNGEFQYSGAWPSGWNFGPGCVTDGADYLFVVNADISGTGTESQIIFLDINDGSELKRLDLADWWVNPDDYAKGGQNCGGPTEIWVQGNVAALGSHTTCVNQLIDPYFTDAADAVLWSNTNGDLIGDHNWEPGSEKAWVCNDYNVGPYKYAFSTDANLFSCFPSFDQGAVSFGLYGPDGTGITYLALAGETAYQKFGAMFVDSGSAYDGLLCTNNIGSTGGIDTTVFWVGSASAKGTLSPNIVGVADAPAAFAVSQNVPNPFNPNTTINYNLAKAGKVTVDVFNVAGQKVASLVNGTMSAGSHSVTWNASKFSAGVYFCTVKSNGASKTLKMTLLK